MMKILQISANISIISLLLLFFALIYFNFAHISENIFRRKMAKFFNKIFLHRLDKLYIAIDRVLEQLWKIGLKTCLKCLGMTVHGINKATTPCSLHGMSKKNLNRLICNPLA